MYIYIYTPSNEADYPATSHQWYLVERHDPNLVAPKFKFDELVYNSNDLCLL